MSEGDYVIAWTAPARRALARLPEKVATAAVEFLYGSLAANPHRVGKPLKLGLDGLHSARRGDYRVIYRIDDQHRRVDVVAIEHRSDIYRSTCQSRIRAAQVSGWRHVGRSALSGHDPRPGGQIAAHPGHRWTVLNSARQPGGHARSS